MTAHSDALQEEMLCQAEAGRVASEKAFTEAAAAGHQSFGSDEENSMACSPAAPQCSNRYDPVRAQAETA